MRRTAALVVLVANSGVRGLVRFPRYKDDMELVSQQYANFVRNRERRIRELIEWRTADEDMQKDIYDVLMNLISRT